MTARRYTKADTYAYRNERGELRGCLVVTGDGDQFRPVTFFDGAARENVARYVRAMNDTTPAGAWVRW